MIKYIIASIPLLVLLWGCGSTRDVNEMSGDERLQYAIGLYNDEDYEEAATEFEAILLQYPGSSIVDDAQYYLGMCKFQREEFILAAYEFSKLIKNMPASEFVADAQFMLGGNPRKYARVVNLPGELFWRHLVQFGSSQHLVTGTE